jgi:hypothetical protein
MERGQTALVKAQAVLALNQAAKYTPDSIVTAVDANDLTQLKPLPAPPPLPPGSNPVQHMLPQAQPGATADPLPPTNPRLAIGSTSPGDGGNGTRPLPRASAARRALEGANGHG